MSQKKAQLLNPLGGNINVTGVITASSFVGSGEGLTGVASTDNIQTATPAKFLSDVSITGVTTVGVVTGGTSISASVFYGDGSALTGIDATKLTDSGGSTIVQANPNGAVVTGVLTATTGSFSGNVTIGGTLTYQDVESIDSIGIITAQQGIQVLANGLDVTGVSTFTGNILPEANGTRDLGATGTRWANIYTSDLDLSNEARGGNDIDGTWGSYTIQEGENDLYLINRRTGKTYKFVLEEIN